jgi:glycosyltransferase involved in cell wall biosynthesis
MPMNRPVVLVFAPYYHPAFRAGGPVRTLRNMVAMLRDDIDFRIFTKDRDFGDAQPFAEVRRGEWCDVDGARVFYGAASDRTLAALGRLVREVAPDSVYLNSFFDPAFSIRPLLARRLGITGRAIPWILAPRGEFSPGAIRIKQAKKRLFLAASRAVGLHRRLVWQASSDFEKRDIVAAMGGIARRIHVAANLTAPVDPLAGSVVRSSDGVLRICFLSRVSPKKNLLYAIDVVRRARCPIVFDIYGPLEDRAYWETCQKGIANAPPGCRIEWKGEVPHEDVRRTLAGYDLMLFPTHGENFGHVIFESLAAGVPVLVSDQTPWRDLDARGSGWVRSLDDPRAFVDVIEAAADRDGAARQSGAIAAHAQALEVSRSAAVLGANRDLFLAPGGDPRPAE